MSDYEMGMNIKRLKRIADYTEKHGTRPTTAALGADCNMKEYHQLRQALAFLEKEGLILRHPDDSWGWSVTAKGRGFIHAWRIG